MNTSPLATNSRSGKSELERPKDVFFHFHAVLGYSNYHSVLYLLTLFKRSYVCNMPINSHENRVTFFAINRDCELYELAQSSAAGAGPATRTAYPRVKAGAGAIFQKSTRTRLPAGRRVRLSGPRFYPPKSNSKSAGPNSELAYIYNQP